MKFFVCIALFAVVAGTVCASQGSSSSAAANTNANKDLESDAAPVQTAQLNNDFNRFRKSAGYGGGAAAAGGGYGGASIPAPPCPKNYLFSCQPNLAPVPCAAPAASYGSSGAYTANVPTYMAPVGNSYGMPQHYNGFAPQPFNQFYQY